MNWKNRLTNYNFWISIFSAVLLILQALKIEFDIVYVNEIFTAVLGLLVVIGIISDPTRTSVKSTESSLKSTSQETKVEENKLKKAIEKENKLPTNKKNETDNVDNETDLQAILANIASDLNAKFQELKQINFETVNTIIKKESEETSILEEESKETSQTELEPAVAEMENPYLDVMN